MLPSNTKGVSPPTHGIAIQATTRNPNDDATTTRAAVTVGMRGMLLGAILGAAPTGAGAAQTLELVTSSSSVFVDTAPSESRTRSVTRNVPALLGTPAIVPVPAASFRPAGSEPRAIVQRRAGTPPRKATFAR